MVSIVFSEGPLAGQKIELTSGLTVGREGSDITLDDHQVSRQHLALRPAGDGLQVEDLGSTNGTFVNARRISGTVTVQHGDVISLGTCEAIVQADRPADPTMPYAVPAGAVSAATTGGGLPPPIWAVTALVEITLVLAALSVLVYYAVR